MDAKSIFTKTAKGLGEAVGKTKALSRELRNILKEIDGKASVEELQGKLGNVSEAELQDALTTLVNGNYIREFASPAVATDIDLDFTLGANPNDGLTEVTMGGFLRALSSATAAEQKARADETLHKEQAAVRAKADAERNAKAVREAVEQARRVAREKEIAGREAEQRARKAAEQKARIEAEAQAKREAEERARREAAEQARQKAAQQALREAQETARREAEQQVIRETQEKARRDAELQALREAQEKARSEAEQQARKDAAEKARLEAEERARLEAEEKVRLEAEEKARLKAAVEKIRRDAIEKYKRDTEERARKEAEERARVEAEEQARQEAEEQARKDAEEKARREAEEQAQREAEEKSRLEAEAKARQQAEEQARRDAEEKARREAEEQAQREAEEKSRLEAEVKARQQAEEQARRDAEEKARREAEEQARREAEEQARREADERARAEAEERRKLEAEQQARREAEQQAKQQAEREAKEKARLEAEAKARKEAEERTRRKAKEKEARAKREAAKQAEREAKRQAEREAQEKARLAAAALAKQEAEAAEALAKQQVEDEEERQARQQAEREAEQEAAYQAEQAAISRKPEKHYRKPVKWSKYAALSLFFLAVAGVVLVQVMPFDEQARLFEKTAAAQFQQPVTIREAHLALIPQPHWRLDGVSIGKNAQIKVARIDAMAELNTLFSDKIVFNTVEVTSPVMNGEGLGWLLFRKPQGRELKNLTVTASNAKLDMPGLGLPAFDARTEIGADGMWQKMILEDADKKTRIELQPKGETAQIELSADAFAALSGYPFPLEKISAKGTANRNELVLTEFNGLIHGGVITGNARLRWGASWSLTGDVTARQLNAATWAPQLLEGGKLDGNAKYALHAQTANQLFSTPHLRGNVKIHTGAVLGVDLISLLRGFSPGGKSSFSELSGGFAYESGKLQLRNVQLQAGLVSANGNADVDADNKLSGRFTVNLTAPTRQARANLTVSGTLNEPRFAP